uniref:Peroxidase n=1 Tax=Tanacetum cinerariifolium TaxID=118510 RepID=A0A699HYU8_TANCI|nr:peroxidase 64-like [Tanacetum cinerariifolium]
MLDCLIYHGDSMIESPNVHNIWKPKAPWDIHPESKNTEIFAMTYELSYYHIRPGTSPRVKTKKTNKRKAEEEVNEEHVTGRTNGFFFESGCDGSVLLNSTKNNQAEKDGPPNISLHAFYVIDNAKKALEAMCPGTVSCADIVALAARDAVHLSGGPSWVVPKGRKDGRISKATETRQLPAPTFNISQLQQSFSQRGLDISDLVALSGGHTLGFAHCSSFQNRIHNFATTQDVDPSLQQAFAASLRSVCPIHNKVNSAGANLDSTPTIFDNRYYKLLLEGESIFSSDQALLTNPTTKNLVKKYAYSREEFEKAFVESMIKMSSITGGQEELTFFAEVMNHSGTFEISSSSIDDK